MPHRPTASDATPLKDAARGLRFAFDKGRATLKQALPLSLLPEPLAKAAGSALAGMDQITNAAERQTRSLARSLLPEDTSTTTSLDDLTNAAGAEHRFAAAFYRGMQFSLRALGVDTALISETTASATYAQSLQHGTAASDTALAARLMPALIAAGTLRDATLPATLDMTFAELTRLATFATLLALLSDDHDLTVTLPACANMALALRSEIAAAQNDEAALHRLFDEFRHHV